MYAATGAHSRRGGFSLVELLTVMFVIALLIAILVPSVTAARTAAKNLKTRSFIRALETGLESFRADRTNEYPATNGYPPSYTHPPIGSYGFNALKGEFPFAVGNTKPTAFGAHWLPAMLIGHDAQGVVVRSAVPPAQRNEPFKWYDPGFNTTPIDRSAAYVSYEDKQLKKTDALPGQPAGGKDSPTLFPNWSATRKLPVFVDSFDQAILYYTANKHAATNNLVEEFRDPAQYGSGPQPYYFHEDNRGFTGISNNGSPVTPGWNYMGTTVPAGQMLHWISDPGHTLNATQLNENALDSGANEHRKTFAYYILDRKALAQVDNPTTNTPVRPLRHDSFLLISPGPDGRYGTSDDITNLPERDN